MPKESSFRYKIKLTTPRGEEFTDVITCAFIRSPFFLRASYCELKINISSMVALQIQNDLSRNVDIYLRLELCELAYEGQPDEYNQKLKETDVVRKLYERNFKCIKISKSLDSRNRSDKKINLSDMNSCVYLRLVNPILADLDIKNGFNKRLTNVTAYEAIEKYLDFLKKEYGDNFYKHFVGFDDEHISKYKYSQLLIKTKNDLGVLDYLIYNKKPTLSLPLYIFDDFCMDPKCDKMIAIHFINLLNNESKDFKKLDIKKYFDTLYSTVKIKEIPFKTNAQDLTHGIETFVFRSPKQISNSVVKSSSIFKSQVSKSEFYNEVIMSNEDNNKDDTERSISYVITHMDFNNKAPMSKALSVYVPDNIKNAEKRIQNYRYLIEGKIEQFVQTQTVDCFCDWLQFGWLYNFELTDIKENQKIFTPIDIKNLFYKSDKFSLRHVAKSMMLQYYSGDSTCESCHYFVSGNSKELYGSYCSLHNKPRMSTTSCNDYKEK